MKPTLGPWVVRPGAPKHAALIVRELPHYKSTVVATIPMHFDFGDAAVTDWAEQEGNARLVAAAPDLVDAAREALRLLQQSGFARYPQTSKVVDALRTAITKATGSV